MSPSIKAMDANGAARTRGYVALALASLAVAMSTVAILRVCGSEMLLFKFVFTLAAGFAAGIGVGREVERTAIRRRVWRKLGVAERRALEDDIS